MDRNKLLDSAFESLFEISPLNYNFKINYSQRFKKYNANVSYRGNNYIFNLSYEWKDVSLDIQVGVIQYLMVKAFSKKITPKNKLTLNIELYNSFLKQIHKYQHKKIENSDLLDSFKRVNHKYFFNSIEECSLKWGQKSTRTLGHYSYGSDTIVISNIFNLVPLPFKLIDFIMYHEMLHKKHKFKSSVNGRNLHHSTEFRNDEKKFENFKQIDLELKQFIRNHITKGRTPKQNIKKNTFFDFKELSAFFKNK